MGGEKDSLATGYAPIRQAATLLAGRPGDRCQRASVHHLYGDSGGRTVFPLITTQAAPATQAPGMLQSAPSEPV